MVILKQFQGAENIPLIMMAGIIPPRYPAQEQELSYPDIMNIGNQIQETLRQPPQANAGPEGIPLLKQEDAEHNRRHQQLSQRTSTNRHKLAKGNIKRI